MPSRIVPIRPLHDPVDAVLRSAREYVRAVHRQDQLAANEAYVLLDAAVHDETRIREMHHASLTTPPALTVIDGGRTS